MGELISIPITSQQRSWYRRGNVSFLDFAGRGGEQPPLSPGERFQQHVNYFKQNWRREGLPKNWYELSGTGFIIESQVNLMFDGLSSKDSPQTRQEKMKTKLSQAELDIQSFALEYLARGLVFPNPYKIVQENGEAKMVNPLYGNKDIVDLVSEEERNGVVKAALKDKVKPFFIDAEDGALGVMVSPSGWSGLKTKEGKAIRFPDSQTYVWVKMGDDVLGFTLRTDLSYKEHREFLKRLTTGKINLPENADVTEYVANVALLSPSEAKGRNFFDVAKLMKEVRKDLTGRNDAFEGRGWDEMMGDLRNGDTLLKFNEEVDQELEGMKAFFHENTLTLTRQQAREGFATAVLRIARLLGVGREQVENQIRVARGYTKSRDGKVVHPNAFKGGFGEVFKEVQARGGCAGGGEENALLESLGIKSLGARLGVVDSAENSDAPKYDFDQPGPCRVCSRDVNCGPCAICQSCDVKIREKEKSKKTTILAFPGGRKKLNLPFAA